MLSARGRALVVGSPSGAAFARPKSSTFKVPSSVTMTFAGFRSRWMMDAACARARAVRAEAVVAAPRSSRAAPAQQIAKRRSRDVLHRDVRSAGIRGPDVVDRDDVRMIECRSGLRLAEETARSVLAVRLQGLDGDVSAQPIVAGLVDDSHPTGPDDCANFIWTDATAGRAVHQLARPRPRRAPSP